jgi:hypothetical protein
MLFIKIFQKVPVISAILYLFVVKFFQKITKVNFSIEIF